MRLGVAVEDWREGKERDERAAGKLREGEKREGRGERAKELQPFYAFPSQTKIKQRLSGGVNGENL